MKAIPTKEYETPAELSQGGSKGHSKPISSATGHGKDPIKRTSSTGNLSKIVIHQQCNPSTGNPSTGNLSTGNPSTVDGLHC